MKYFLILFIILAVGMGLIRMLGIGRSCGGDWSYMVKCPPGTYCKSLNMGPYAGGTCVPVGF